MNAISTHYAPKQLPHIIVVGGGFGGLAAVQKFKNKNVKVTLIDKNNYHLFQPLLYQVATAGLSPAEIAFPLRSLLAKQKNVNILMEKVLEIDKEQKFIVTDSGRKFSFDYLILACGATYTYFNSPQWEPYAPGLKTITQATEIRKRIFLAFENAEKETDNQKLHELLTFVVVGGGPTGVELAGAIGEIARFTLARDFKHINPQDTKVILLEAGPRILPSFDQKLSLASVEQLNELGVVVKTNCRVIDINDRGITTQNEVNENEFIPSHTILWAAGVGANPLNKTLGVELDKNGRIIVETDTSIKNFPYIFVIGDQANYQWAMGNPSKTPLPGLSPVAMQQGRYVAHLIMKEINGRKKRKSFSYLDKGQMATIGKIRAVASFKNIHVKGFIAWFLWLFVHIFYLIGFRNRIFVFFEWAWTYLTSSRGARLIIKD